MDKNKSNIWTDEDRFKHMSWCLANDIKIYFKPTSMNTGVIVIEDKGKIFVSEEEYKSDNTLKKRRKGETGPKKIYSERIFELYTIKYLEKNEY